jgi:hypothetical protein
MNTDDLMIYMVSTAVFTLIAVILGHYAIRYLNLAEVARKRVAANASRRREVRPAVSQRRAHSYPGIICALPMYQVKRAEASMGER